MDMKSVSYIFFTSCQRLCGFTKERWFHLVAALSNIIKKEMFFIFKVILTFQVKLNINDREAGHEIKTL